jgi:hypothetical protein
MTELVGGQQLVNSARCAPARECDAEAAARLDRIRRECDEQFCPAASPLLSIGIDAQLPGWCIALLIQ